MKSDFSIAVTQLAAERKLPKERVLEAIEAALSSAYKRDNMAGEDIAVRLNPATGEVKVFTLKTVAEEVGNPQKDILLKEARRLRKDAQIGDTIEMETSHHNAGRIAAQTAKQVVMQRLREAERELVFEEYIEREDEIVSGIIQRGDRSAARPTFTVDLDRTEATFPPNEQVETERYRPGQRLKFYILEVLRTSKGPEIVLSRTHKNLIKRLFELEVPEIFNGVVQIKSISREPGSRSKVAVAALQDGVDPVGACVGLRGIRIQNIVNELQGEKIDIVQWHGDMAVFIASALSPAQPIRVDLDEAAEIATVTVPDKQQSLAIGRDGQNARLTAKLTGWKIDIKNATEVEADRQKQSLEGRPIAMARAVAAEAAEAAKAEARDIAVVADEEEAVAVVADEEEAVAVVSDEKERAAAVVVDEKEKAAATVTGEEAPQLEPVSVEGEAAISPEEELLALEAPKEATPAEGVAEGIPEDEGVEEFSQEIWKVPTVVFQGPQIRFAEDIMGPRPPRREKRRKKGRRPVGAAVRGQGGKQGRSQDSGSAAPG